MNISAINNNYTGFVQNPVSSVSKITPEEDSIENSRVYSKETDRHTGTQNNSAASDIHGYELTQAEMQLLQELKLADTNVRRHEMAHIAAGGRYITSGAHFTYKQGPDGRNYVVGGEVSIDTSPVPGDPQATIQKMRQVKNAALAPVNPSPQDIKVASQASQKSSKALSELMMLEAERRSESNNSKAFGNLQQASDSYVKVNNLPEDDTSSFQIAV